VCLSVGTKQQLAVSPHLHHQVRAFAKPDLALAGPSQTRGFIEFGSCVRASVSPSKSFITEVSHMNATVSILAEIPEDLHLSLKGYLETHPDWDQDRVFCAALSLFLLQHVSSNSPTTAHCYRRAARVYLDTLFKHAV
jgi:hypothetical protein